MMHYHNQHVDIDSIKIQSVSVTPGSSCFIATPTSHSPHIFLSLWQPLSCPPCAHSVFPKMLYESIHTVYNLLELTFVRQHISLEIYPHCCVYQ